MLIIDLIKNQNNCHIIMIEFIQDITTNLNILNLILTKFYE